MQILATLLNSQFGQAHVDQQQGLVMLQVSQSVNQLYTRLLKGDQVPVRYVEVQSAVSRQSYQSLFTEYAARQVSACRTVPAYTACFW